MLVFLVVPFGLRMHAIGAHGDFMATVYRPVVMHLDAIAYGVLVALSQPHCARVFQWWLTCLCAGSALVASQWAQMAGVQILP